MKGLLIKDLKLMKHQRQFLLVLLVFTGFFLITDTDFVVGYLTSLVTMFVLGTINYDEYDNGYAFLFTLPIDRRSYVREKYALLCLMNIASSIFACGLVYGYRVLTGTDPLAAELLCSAAAIILLLGFMVALLLPLQFKFGSEKSRMALFGIVGVTLAIGLAAMELLDDSAAAKALAGRLAENAVLLGGILAGSVLLILWISYKISVKIMESKEF